MSSSTIDLLQFHWQFVSTLCRNWRGNTFAYAQISASHTHSTMILSTSKRYVFYRRMTVFAFSVSATLTPSDSKRYLALESRLQRTKFRYAHVLLAKPSCRLITKRIIVFIGRFTSNDQDGTSMSREQRQIINIRDTGSFDICLRGISHALI